MELLKIKINEHWNIQFMKYLLLFALVFLDIKVTLTFGTGSILLIIFIFIFFYQLGFLFKCTFPN